MLAGSSETSISRRVAKSEENRGGKDSRIRFVDIGSSIWACNVPQAPADLDKLEFLAVFFSFRCCVIPIGAETENGTTVVPDRMDRSVFTLRRIRFTNYFTRRRCQCANRQRATWWAR